MTKTAIQNKQIEQEKALKQAELERDRQRQRHQQAHEISENEKKNKIEKTKTWAKFGSDMAGHLLKFAGNFVGGKSDGNHPEWYMRYIENGEPFTNIPTFAKLGNLSANKYTLGTNSAQSRKSMVGVNRFWYYSAVGPQPWRTYSGINNNPVNQILMRSKEQVLKLSSRSNVNWEAADLGLNIFATADIITVIKELGRALKCYNKYLVGNRFYGSDFVNTVLGFTIDATNASEWKRVYEQLRLRFNHACVAPKALSIYDRKAYLADNIFLDELDEQAQTYVFVHNSSFWKLSADGSQLNMTAISKSSPSAFLSDVGGMITAIAENPDYIEMYQDLRHAVSDDELFVIESVAMDEEIVPIYNIDTLMQIKNMETPFGEQGSSSASGASTQGTTVFSCANGYLYMGTSAGTGTVDGAGFYAQTGAADPKLTASGGIDTYAVSDKLLHRYPATSYKGAEEIIENTRFKLRSIFDYTTDTNHLRELLVGCGTEVVFTVNSYHFVDGGSPLASDAYPLRGISTGNFGSQMCYKQVNAAFQSGFFPDIYILDKNTVSTGLGVLRLGSVDKYSPISPDNIQSMHEFCTLSLLYFNVKSFKSR